jgi:hypothetical protein
LNIQQVLRTARLISWTYRLLSTLVGLVAVRLVNDGIGLAGYGDLAFLLAFVTGVGAIDLGFLQSMSRFVARLEGDPSRERGAFWATCLLLIVGLFILQGMLVVLLAAALGATGQLRGLAVHEAIAIGTTFIVGNLLTVSAAVYAGWQRYGMSGAAKIGRSLIYLVAVVLLWYTNELSVRSVLWANALAILAPNALVVIFLLARQRSGVRCSWAGFPSAHRSQGGEMLNYSLRGWLFTASTIAVSSGAVFVAGLVLPATSVAKLQIGLMLYTGTAAFVTGSMVPLTTIRSRLSDKSAESRAKISATARSLTEDAIMVVAILLGFFTHYTDLVLNLLIGTQASDPTVLSQTRMVVLVVVLPGLAVLPWFTFRFALVEHDENARYSARLFAATAAFLTVTALAGAFWSDPLIVAVGVAFALVYRGSLAFAMGAYVAPGLSSIRVLTALVSVFVLCSALGGALRLFDTGWRWGPADVSWLRAGAYLAGCALLVIVKRRLWAHAALGLLGDRQKGEHQ